MAGLRQIIEAIRASRLYRGQGSIINRCYSKNFPPRAYVDMAIIIIKSSLEDYRA